MFIYKNKKKKEKGSRKDVLKQERQKMEENRLKKTMET
jgi:hypothetical protein